MQKTLFKTIISSTIAILGSTIAIAAPVNAGTLHTKAGFNLEWNYSIDSIRDGEDRRTLNYKGMALTETDDRLIFALSSDLDYDEKDGTYNTTHGDLFLNFSGEKFHTANGSDNIFAVKFAPNNSNNLDVGVYSNVTAGLLANSRWSNLRDYYAAGYAAIDSFGTDLFHPDDVLDYFYSQSFTTSTTAGTPLFNGIQSGTKIGDISMLDRASLDNLGLDFEHFNAADEDIFGIAIDKSLFSGLLPLGLSDFVAHVSLEYGDGVALKGGINMTEAGTPVDGETVPEPATLLGLSAIGLALIKCKRDRSARAKS